jgi:alpha-D-xyloside xylohydrolase
VNEYNFEILNNTVDVSKEFGKLENLHFNAMNIMDFNPETSRGTINFKRYSRKVRLAFDQVVLPFEETKAWEFPTSYPQDFECPFEISFINDNTLRIRMTARQKMMKSNEPSLMLLDTLLKDYSWKASSKEKETIYQSSKGSVTITYNPFHLEIRDSKGKLLTQSKHFNDVKSLHTADTIPFSFIRRASDMKRYIAASFSLSHDEKIFGCGESYTRLNKRGQKIALWTSGSHSGQTKEMYKPIPFFLSSEGYGMFVHSSAPITFDFGHSHDSTNTIYLGEDYLDIFIFIGNPKEILSEYTALTGRSPVPPLWTFGLWMSRITYKSEEEVREVASKLREYRIPCDVIHIDTGWFEKDWRCDYKFSKTRFPEPEKMIQDLKRQGFHICLWQLPYFTPDNELYRDAIEKGYVVFDSDGNLPTEDAIVDFSNPEAVKWYQGLLEGLLRQGVEAIKVDFGEAAPLHGIYASGKSGVQEHNLYPLRYNKAIADLTKELTGETIIWARSAWAGSQRYPIHWGGDIENTDCGMAATLRAGLSLGLCGFSFWSHDIGGFVKKSPEELYRRWLPFGMLTSHSRCHGAPPKEPWYFSESFLEDFRKAVELKYTLMPYVYAQAVDSAQNGYPMMRTLFFEFPEDQGSWFIEDEYMFGSDMLVAPLMDENSISRSVYVPQGIWIDYQTGENYEGGRFYNIQCGDIPIILLAKDGAVIPHAKLAQSTDAIEWNEVELRLYSAHEKNKFI